MSRRTPTPSASNWPRYLPRKLVGGGEASPSDRRKQWPVHATLRAPRARGASRCMRGAENLVLQEGQAARRDLTRALKAGPPGEVPRDHTAPFRAPWWPAWSPLGARCTRHTVSPETLPCPSIVKCDLVCKCHLRTAVHLYMLVASKMERATKDTARPSPGQPSHPRMPCVPETHGIFEMKSAS